MVGHRSCFLYFLSDYPFLASLAQWPCPQCFVTFLLGAAHSVVLLVLHRSCEMGTIWNGHDYEKHDMRIGIDHE
jgi:hypothetical protein